MNASPPSQWPGKAMGMAIGILVAACCLYLAARLVVAAAPVLIAVAVTGLLTHLAWHVYRHRRGGW